MPRVILYADIYLVVNWVMNFLLLLATLWATGVRRPLWRVGLAALFGAFYALGQFYPAFSRYYGPGGKLLATLLLTAGVVYPLAPANYFRFTLLFLLSSFLVAGAGLGLVTLMPGNSLAPRPWWWLLAALVLVFSLGRWGWLFLVDRHRQKSFILDLGISFAGREVRLKALLDTGHRLREPLTGRPVVIIGEKGFWELMPPEIAHLLEPAFRRHGHLDLEDLAGAFARSPWAERFRLIPFSGIANQGVLGGLKPDAIKVYREQGYQIVPGIVALAKEKDFAGEEWEALVSPDFLPQV